MMKRLFTPQLPDEFKEYRPLIDELIDRLEEVTCTPTQSGFTVREGLVTSEGGLVFGGNHEYGQTRGIHGEEALISAAIQTLGLEGLNNVIALAIRFPDDGVVKPCGNCRDVLRAYLQNPNILMLGVGPGDSPVRITRLGDYYFEDFKEFHGKLPEGFEQAKKTAQTAMEHASDPHGTPSSGHPSGAAVVGNVDGEKKAFSGTFVGDAAFHARQAVGNALASAVAHGCGEPEYVVIVADGQPLVPYRERQYLLEVSPKLKVFLISLSDGKVWLSAPHEMLPYNFGPHSFKS